jgi:protein SCO1/2
VPALDERQAVRDSQAVVGSHRPIFACSTARARPVRLADYRGKPLLVSFIYTGCFQVCPTQTRRCTRP